MNRRAFLALPLVGVVPAAANLARSECAPELILTFAPPLRAQSALPSGATARFYWAEASRGEKGALRRFARGQHG